MSQAERLEQLYEFLHINDCPLNEFLSAGYDAPLSLRNEWEGTNIIVLVATFSSWDIMVDKVLQWNIHRPVLPATCSLQTMLEGHRQNDRPSQDLPKTTRGEFQLIRKQRPILDNDLRVALFVCLPTDDPVAMLSKCQAALIMNMQSRSSPFYWKTPIVDRLETFGWGREKGLFLTGTQWMGLGVSTN